MKSGFVSIVGRPNVGKSTLLNKLLNQKIAITSDKVGTTRNTIYGIYNDEDSQIVFVDTPGINKATSKLGEVLNNKAYSSFDNDLVLFLVDIASGFGPNDNRILNRLKEDNKDVILHLINNVMRNNELSKEFTIRVSENDYNYVISNKELIYGAASPDYNIEICKDSKLSKNQCVIETDAGVFDCSLDIQLENLIHEIKILSCVH